MPSWKPTVAQSGYEQRLLKPAGKSRKLFVFLREHRHELFDDAFQAELEEMYRQTGQGQLLATHLLEITAPKRSVGRANDHMSLRVGVSHPTNFCSSRFANSRTNLFRLKPTLRTDRKSPSSFRSELLAD